MRPTKDEDGLVDLLDVILRDGAVLRADVIISVAEIPLVGVKLTAAIAGMETMTDYGLFEEWDTSRRNAAVARRQYGHRDHVTSGVENRDRDRVGVGSTPNSGTISVAPPTDGEGSSRGRVQGGEDEEEEEEEEE
ncbi:gas vesicle protein GvpM [Halomontanus rarus]|uniref:gas vesicle protein GvpM n=1 Tax=Halomontanus rarus TaxID=3034020 RepID=UPI0023E8A93C|nr:gas vesicle protein [Halovivax sp. TS33]